MSRIIKIVLTTLLLWRLGLANTNNHQLSSSISPSGPDPGGPASTAGSSRPSSTSSSSSRRRESTYEGQSWKQHVAGEGKLIDNKLRDKLLSLVEEVDRRRSKRESGIPEEDDSGHFNIKNFYDNRISNERKRDSADDIPRITEQVLPVDNLTDDRIREETELLEHLNREHFADGAIRMSGTADGTSSAVRKHPGGGGKKGRRRKVHKKKIKRIKPSPSADDGAADSLIAPENDPSLVTATDDGQSSNAVVTKLSLNGSEQQSQKPGRKKHRQTLAPDGEIKKGQKSAAPRKNGNWDRRAGRELVLLNSDDIYDKNMQITARGDGRPEVAVNLPDGPAGSSGSCI